jgi:hypothetical protein
MNQHHLGYALGLYDESQSPQVESLRRHCEESINDPTFSVNAVSNYCKGILDYITAPTGDVNQMDSRYFSADNMPSDIFQDMFKYSTQAL